KEGYTPPAPTEVRDGIDPIVERLIIRCLERDPRGRPASAAQISTALPGGDPLAAALAAGETPSPAMVAASGLKEGLQPAVAVAWVLLAFVVGGSIAGVMMSQRSEFLLRVGSSKSPAALVERAQQFIKQAGFTDEPADSAFGFTYDADLLQYAQENRTTAIPW